MNTLNMNQHSGYQMLQIAKIKENIIEFCHDKEVTTEDKISITLRGRGTSRSAKFDISEIIEQRKANGKHSVNGVKWYKVQVCERTI